MNKSFLIRINLIGFAGDGVISTGDMIQRLVVKSGYYSTVYKNIPSSIQDGITSSLITISTEPISSPLGQVDILFCLHTPLLYQHVNQLKLGAILFINCPISESEQIITQSLLRENSHSCHMFPFSTISAKHPSAILLGIVTAGFNIDTSFAIELFKNRFSTIQENSSTTDTYKTAFTKGYNWAVQNSIHIHLSPPNSPHQTLAILDANQIISIAALIAGCRFFASYPITPATTIGETLAEILPEHGGCIYQAEDEIAALGAVIGASFSGVKSMTATSGPGLSLMQEEISYLSMAELPAVIVDVMRSGPSTGMPTRQGQDDLLAAIFGGHGESQRIVIAPTSINDCYSLTIDAFNCAEQFSCPVIFLSDYALASTKTSLSPDSFKDSKIIKRNVNCPDHQSEFKRYDESNSVYPFLPAPGLSKCVYHVTGLEHDPASFPTENPEIRNSQVKKRFRKFDTLFTSYSHLFEWDLEEQTIYTADISLISWGFTALNTRVAVKQMREKKFRVAALYPKLLFPVFVDAITELKKYCQTIIVPEDNFTGQYALLLKMYTDVQPLSICNSSGQPSAPDQLQSQIENLLRNENNSVYR